MPTAWLTLKMAARHLGVPPWRVRRMIREGMIHGELRRGRHGLQYYVPQPQVDEIREALVAEVQERAPTLEEIMQRLDAMVAERQDGIQSELEGLRADLADAVEAQAQREEALRAELEQIRTEIAAGLAALKGTPVVDPDAAPAPRWHLWRWRPWRWRG